MFPLDLIQVTQEWCCVLNASCQVAHFFFCLLCSIHPGSCFLWSRSCKSIRLLYHKANLAPFIATVWEEIVFRLCKYPFVIQNLVINQSIHISTKSWFHNLFNNYNVTIIILMLELSLYLGAPRTDFPHPNSFTDIALKPVMSLNTSDSL